MIDTGDIYLADLNHERRRLVMVVSRDRFHQIAQRALVAPLVTVEPLSDELPWRIDVGGDTFAIDLVRSLPVSQLLERVGRAPTTALLAARRALLAIT